MGVGCYYVLGPDGEPHEVDDAMAWAKWYENKSNERRVAFTEIAPGLTVSTVFLAIDHSFGDDGPPILFETMVFGGDWSEQDQERYATIEQARVGHAAMVTKVIETINRK